jgi:hypothetical protein
MKTEFYKTSNLISSAYTKNSKTKRMVLLIFNYKKCYKEYIEFCDNISIMPNFSIETEGYDDIKTYKKKSIKIALCIRNDGPIFA